MQGAIRARPKKIAAGVQVRGLILSWNPDAVIASDDNLSKYAINPYFKNNAILFM